MIPDCYVDLSCIGDGDCSIHVATPYGSRMPQIVNDLMGMYEEHQAARAYNLLGDGAV